MKRIVVAGSGPAGLSASLAAAERGAEVDVFERMPSFGCKLLASGGGKCNVTNALSEEEFSSRFGREGRFMLPALRFAYHDWLFSFLKKQGVELRLTDGFHYFPVSERARDILNAFRHAAEGVRFHAGTEITEILHAEGRVTGVRLANGEALPCDAVILACGGTANKGLGGTDAGLRLARSLGHEIAPPFPAMAPLLIREEYVRSLTGVSLPSAGLSFRRGRMSFSNSGELLFTHAGLSGPCAIDLAGDLAETCHRDGETELVFSPVADMTPDDWKCEIGSWKKKGPAKFFRTCLGWKFTHSFADAFCTETGISEKKLCDFQGSVLEKTASALAGIRLTAYGAGPMEKAMAMKGGVKLKNVDPDTLESRLVKRVFFAGEILDLVGPCGGYNIQWALSSGRLAGFSAAAD